MIGQDIFCIIFGIAASIGLFVLTLYAVRVKSSKWRLLFMVPFIVILLFTVIAGKELLMSGVYAAGVLLLTGFFTENVTARKISCILSIAGCIVTIPLCTNIKSYRVPDYLEQFEEGFATMRDHYDMTEYKGIDWDELYSKYQPKFKEAALQHDRVANYICWKEFVSEFYDGHTDYVLNDSSEASKSIVKEAEERVYGNDYGLSLMRYTGGDFVAVNVEHDSEIEKAGIHDGTIITSWDGKSPSEYYDQVAYYNLAFPDEENKEFYRPVYMSGIGGDSVELTYIDDMGEEQKINAPKLGYYADRLSDTLKILDKGVVGSNLSWSVIDSSTMELIPLSDEGEKDGSLKDSGTGSFSEGDVAVLRVTSMAYDMESYGGTDYTAMENELRPRFEELKSKGIKKLVLDLRSNSGGSPYMIAALAGIFAPAGEHVLSYAGVVDKKTANYVMDEKTGRYEIGGRITYEGQDLIPDIDIVVLVNAETISAGDHMTAIVADYPNVTVMGFTKSNCSGQAVNGVALDNEASLSFSAIPAMREDGTFFVDSGIDHVGQVPIDIKIPFDEEAMTSLFVDGEDYLLKCAVEY